MQKHAKICKKLKATLENRKYVNNLPKIYLVVQHAKWHACEYPFSGEYTKDGIPLVYYFFDFNGEREPAYYLSRIDRVTSGKMYGWYNDAIQAENVVKKIKEVYV